MKTDKKDVSSAEGMARPGATRETFIQLTAGIGRRMGMAMAKTSA
jgi:hypothetical protein